MTAPTTTDLAVLDQQARAAQAANAAKVGQLILAYWLANVRPEDIALTSGPWLDFAVGAVLRGYEQSVNLAAAYAQAVQRIEIPGARPIEIPRPSPPPVEQIRRSLTFTGPGKLAVSLAKIPGETPQEQSQQQVDADRLQRAAQQIKVMREDARRTAGATAAASAYRQVQNGGRDTTLEMVRQKVAVGYVRVTKEHPCAFCMMLASRGPVYGKDSFAQSDPRFTGQGTAKVHDGCGCSLRPLYSKREEHWTPQARQADELWKEMLRTKKPGDDPANAFARLVRERGIADLTRF
jgi:hypothetical protein